jgi:hypothetical protein
MAEGSIKRVVRDKGFGFIETGTGKDLWQRGDTRGSVLEQAAREAAHSWTLACAAQLELERRNAEGGWPGTMTEARARAFAHATTALAARSMAALTHEECARLARLTYDEARKSWSALTKL